jgi:hypothetical protein
VPRLEELEARVTPVTVNSTADMLGTPPPGIITLRKAIGDGATSIDFSPNVSGGVINLVATLPTLNGVTISNNTGNPITVLGNFHFQLIQTAARTSNEIDNLELEQGGGVDDGGGILNAGSLTLSGCYISLCSATSNGGAIYNNGAGATLTLENTTLFRNTAGWGGAIFNSNGEVNVYSGSIIDDNNATAGGGIWNDSGTLDITGASVVKNNKASGNGGGIYNFGGTLTVSGASLTNNTAGDRGGGLFSDGTANLTAMDIEYNSASNAGGGFYLLTGRLTLAFSTLSNNLAPPGAGAGGAYSVGGGASWTNNGGNTITDPVVAVP